MSNSTNRKPYQPPMFMQLQVSPEELQAMISQSIADAFEAQAEAPALLTRDQAAQALQVSIATLGRLRSEGLPTVMVGDHPRFCLQDVLDWLSRRNSGDAA